MKKLFKKDQRGFTLAELLIVVAIIAVLVAVAIPVFTTQLEKSRDAVSIANIRAGYAEAAAKYLTSTDNGTGSDEIVEVELKGTQTGFSGLETELPFEHTLSNTSTQGGIKGTYNATFSWDANGKCTLKTLTAKT